MAQGPYKAKRLRVQIDGQTVGVVEGLSIELIKEGGIEFYYGSETGKHAKGTRHATFSIRRWFVTDTGSYTILDGVHSGDQLLYDLFNDDLPFALSGEVIDNTPSLIYLSDCQIYRFRLVTGTANDIVAEEASGESVDWDGTSIS